MLHVHWRKNSRIPFFRLDVPKDIRDEVDGLTSWQHSLKTTDPTLIKTRAAAYASHYTGEIARLRALKAARNQAEAKALVTQAFDRLAAHFGSIDIAVAGELEKVATIVRSSWSNDEARALELRQFGETTTSYLDPEPQPIPAIDGEEPRRLFSLGADLLESQEQTRGMAYQKLARELLARGVYAPLHFAIGYLPYVVREIDIATPAAYDAVAEAYLAFLADYEFAAWPKGMREALVQIAAPALAEPVSAPAPAPPQFRDPAGFTLRDAFAQWKQGKRITGKNKTADEWEKAIVRFEGLLGVSDTRLITSKMIKTFRTKVAQLPANPKKDIAALTHEEQIAVAEREKLPTLSDPSVGKQVAAIRSLLAIAKDEEWIETNPASGITVEGARWNGVERDHFSDDDMRQIYTSPLMTDPDACGDTMFWMLFLAPFHGSRPGEHCKLKPRDIVEDDGEWVMRIRIERRTRGTAKNDPENRPRRPKTLSSVRDIPLHWIVLEAGFLEFVRLQAARSVEWLFDDLVPNAYGDRYKELSRTINRALRKLGITDTDKAFYSTRHTMKREGRRRRIATQNLNRLAGHASSDIGDKYGQGVPIDILKGDIDQLEFRSVEWDAVVACARARLDRLAHRYGIAA